MWETLISVNSTSDVVELEAVIQLKGEHGARSQNTQQASLARYIVLLKTGMKAQRRMLLTRGTVLAYQK